MSSPTANPSRYLCCYGHDSTLALPNDLPHPLEDWIAGKEFRLFLGEPPPLNNPLLVDKEERPPCSQPAWFDDIMLQDAVTSNDLQVGMVAEEWVLQLERIRKRFLRESIVSTDPEYLYVQVLDRAVVGLPGRHVLGSGRPEIVHVKLE